MKKNGHNSRKSDDIDLKLGPATKYDNRKTTTSKKVDNDVMSKNCDAIVIFPICGQFKPIWKPDSGRMFCKFYIFISRYFLSYKN